jgi:glycosyltransferase involved in cell wall biosynthesis
LLKPLGIKAPAAVIPNGIEPNEIYPLPPAGTFRATLPSLGDHPYILFLSRLHYKKGLDYLAEAFKIVAPQLPDVHLVVAGPDGGAQAEFEAVIREAGLTDRVHLTGPIYGERKLAAYVDATVFCLPSRQEGFSIAITEAMACGTPVVISQQCHFPEVAEAGAGIVVDLAAAAVATALITLLQDTGCLERASIAGRLLVDERFVWSKVAILTGIHYGKLVSETTS